MAQSGNDEIKKNKEELAEEFAGKAIEWASRVGIEDIQTAKPLYWCVVNIYAMQQTIEKMKKTIRELEYAKRR